MSINLNISFNNTNNAQITESKAKNKAETVAQKFFKDSGRVDSGGAKEKLFSESKPTFSINKSTKMLSNFSETKKVLEKKMADSGAISEYDELKEKIENCLQNIKQRNANIEEILENDQQSDWYQDLFEEFGFENVNPENIAKWKEQYQVNLDEGSLEENGQKIRDIRKSEAFKFIKDIFVSRKHGPVLSFDLIYKKSKKEQALIIENFKKENEEDLKLISKWQAELSNYNLTKLDKKIKTLQAYINFYAKK